MRSINMNAMIYFEAVARHARVNIAAEELMVSPSAVSQTIKKLEQKLGLLLFRRIKRRLVLTEEGERLYQSASEALQILRDAQARMTTHHHLSQKLVIRVASSFGVRWLGPRLPDFVRNNPWIDLHVDATSELTDFEKENVDLEIHYGVTPAPGLHSQPLVTDQVLPMCAPHFADLASQEDLKHRLTTTKLIHTVKAKIRWRAWLDLHGLQDVQDDHGMLFDRSSMSIQMAVDRLGVVLETATLTLTELRTGRLVPLAPDLGCLSFPAYWLTCPARHLNRRAVTAFVAWITQQAHAHEKSKTRLLTALGAGTFRAYDFRSKLHRP